MKLDKNYILQEFSERWFSGKPYRNNMTYREYINLQVHNATIGYSNIRLTYKTIVNELKYLLQDNYNVYGNELFFIDIVLESWINLLREYFVNVHNKNVVTYLYWARVKYHPNYYKIGITKNIEERAKFKNNRYYDYHIISEYENRFIAAYVEYKLRVKYCFRCKEIIDESKLKDILQEKIDIDREELQLLGLSK